MGEWVGRLLFSPEVIAKLATKHNLSPEQVKQAVTCDAHDRDYWGRRPQLWAQTGREGTDADGTGIIAYLRPVDARDGLWRCLTAIRME